MAVVAAASVLAVLPGFFLQSPEGLLFFWQLAYVPLILCGWWWGRKCIRLGIAFAVVASIQTLLSGAFWIMAAPVAGYLLIGWATGTLRARLNRTKHNAIINEKKYRQLMEKSLAGIFIYREDTILYANSRFREIVGYLPEEALGKSFWEYVYEGDQPRVRQQLERRREDPFSDLHYECRLVARDGRTVWAEIVSSNMEYEGRPAVLVSVYNITDRKETEEKRRELSRLARKQEEQLVHSTRLAEMGEMAAGVAHELNQPLTSIKNFARNATFMLEEGEGNPEEVKENLHMISGQVDRASRIINQMRELARRTERHLGPVDVNVALRESVEFVIPQMRLSGVDVVFSLADDLPPVLGDRIRLEQVFLNLLMNARHAMEQAPVRRLDIRTRYEAEHPWPVIIEIADTGHGFAPEVAEKLFQPFFSTKQAGRGTGLGLSISLGIVKDHKGSIEAVGEEGNGAVFTVRLPVSHEPMEFDQ
jgi:histidine kinase